MCVRERGVEGGQGEEDRNIDAEITLSLYNWDKNSMNAAFKEMGKKTHKNFTFL